MRAMLSLAVSSGLSQVQNMWLEGRLMHLVSHFSYPNSASYTEKLSESCDSTKVDIKAAFKDQSRRSTERKWGRNLIPSQPWRMLNVCSLKSSAGR